MNKDFFEHHGIKGMKWGVTRKDPFASEALNRTLSSTIQELEGRLTHEIEETNNVT
jgi:hypothetical protein